MAFNLPYYADKTNIFNRLYLSYASHLFDIFHMLAGVLVIIGGAAEYKRIHALICLNWLFAISLPIHIVEGWLLGLVL